MFQVERFWSYKVHFGHTKCDLVINCGHKKCTWVILGRGLVIRNGVLVIRSDAWVIYFAFGHTVLVFWDVKKCVPCVPPVPCVSGVSCVAAFQGGTWNTPPRICLLLVYESYQVVQDTAFVIAR